VAGSNHILALTHKGKVFAWGAGQQNQLGRRVVERHILHGLKPSEFGLRNIVDIASGSFHSFAIDKSGKVYSWGLNAFGQCGIPISEGEDGGSVLTPTVVKALSGFKIAKIDGAGSHSLACTEDGQLLVWGRVDGSQCGMTWEGVPDENFAWTQGEAPTIQLVDEKTGELVRDERGFAIFGKGAAPPKVRRMLAVPTVLPNLNAIDVAAGNDNSFAIDSQHRAWSWGFSANYQTGQGTDDDVKVATLIDSSAVRGKKIIFAGPGGQFGILASVANV
jgi:regulator of chromosome condensation